MRVLVAYANTRDGRRGRLQLGGRLAEVCGEDGVMCWSDGRKGGFSVWALVGGDLQDCSRSAVCCEGVVGTAFTNGDQVLAQVLTLDPTLEPAVTRGGQ